MYSVEEEEKQKSEEKPDDAAVTRAVDNEDKTFKDVENTTKKVLVEREDDIETTEYDISTDEDSLRMIYSSTDQVSPLKRRIVVSARVVPLEIIVKLVPEPSPVPTQQSNLVPNQFQGDWGWR